MWQLEKKLRSEGIGLIAGVDEAGRGPLCGPVVAAAFVTRRLGSPRGVADSKTLSEQQRNRLYPLVIDAAAGYSVGIASAREIDEINILEATRLAMARALRSLSPAPDIALVDGLELEGPPPCRKIIGGDATVACIAAASIIAKVTRDALMLGLHRSYPEYHFDRNKGYGTPEHLRALRRLGPTPYHRFTFNGVRQPKLVI
jgi:ribonuclease HII